MPKFALQKTRFTWNQRNGTLYVQGHTYSDCNQYPDRGEQLGNGYFDSHSDGIHKPNNRRCIGRNISSRLVLDISFPTPIPIPHPPYVILLMSSVTGHTGHTAQPERPQERSRNAKAQARHRAKRKAYIDQVCFRIVKSLTSHINTGVSWSKLLPSSKLLLDTRPSRSRRFPHHY